LAHHLARHRLCVALALAAAVAASLGLSGCGRKGPLDLPPSDVASASKPPPPAPTASLPGASPSADPSAETAQQTAARTGFDSRGNPVAAPGEKKGFLLDPLLQ
jgi:predicted small lipoprotein YifL